MKKGIQLSIFLFFISIFSVQAQITTYVWEDLDGNGLQDDGAPLGGLDNGEIQLWFDVDMDGVGESDTGIFPTEGAVGEYSFNGMADGDYVIVYTAYSMDYFLTQGGSEADGADPTDDSDVSVSFTAGIAIPTTGTSHTFNYTAATAPKVNVDAGFFQAASVGDYVFEDMDGDGEQDATDIPLANIDIDITDGLGNPVYDVSGGVVIGTTTSDGAGAYSFADLMPGDYILTFTDPTFTYVVTKQDIVGDNIDSDINNLGFNNGQSPTFSLSSDQDEIDIDAGFFEPIEISDLVWHDLNADGFQDGGLEIGIPNIDVDIYDQTTGFIADNIFGAGTATQVTDGAGNYLFDEMPPGEYYLIFTDPAGLYYNTYPSATATVAVTVDTDSDCGDLVTGIAGQTDPVLYESGDKTVDIDAGLFLPAKIGNYVWEDMDGNGLQDVGEPDLMGINITIADEFGAAVDDVDLLPIGATSSDGVGFYEFVQLRPRNYIITFDDQIPTYYHTKVDEPGVGATDPTDPTDFEDDSDADPTTGETLVIEITSDEDNEYIDAGFYRPCKLGNYVWHDENGDGIDDGTEPPLAGVTVTITDDLGNPVDHVDGTPVLDEMSDAGGMYEFIDLPPGKYYLIFDEPVPYHYALIDYNGGDMDNNDDADDSDPDKNNAIVGRTHEISLESDEDQMDIDAGYYMVTRVGDFVFHDREWNGIFDGTDVGVDGFTVRLFKSDGSPALDFADIDVSTTVTAGGGMFEFIDLPPGDYYVEGVLSGDWLFTQQDFPDAAASDDLNDINNDSDAQDATGANPGRTHEFFLESDELTENRVDLGIYKQIDVGGTIFNDLNEDGFFDIITEGTYADVVLELIAVDVFHIAAGTVVATIISTPLPPGEYLFEDLEPGEYKILVIQQNFIAGAPLFSTESSPGQPDANNDVDNDDNGDDALGDGSESTPFVLTCGEEPEMDGIVNTTVDFGFFVVFDCAASTLSQPSCELVESTLTFNQGGDLICDLNILDSYCATMPMPPLVNPAPNPLCPSGGGPHNMSWFAFVAGNGTYTIEVVPENCVPAPGQSNLGVQTGIYTDCTFSDAIICDPNCSTAPVTLSSAALTPGETYYFFLDGCNGSTCDYSVNILGNFEVFTIPEPDGLQCQTVDCDMPLCPGQEVVIETYDLDLDVTYIWVIPPGVDILNPLDPLEPHITNENNINLGFPTVGTYTICMDEATNFCTGTLIPVCIDIVVEELEDELFDDEGVCENHLDGYVPVTTDDPNGDGTEGWQVTPAPFDFMDGVPFTGSVTTDAGCVYDQTITINTIKLKDPERLDTAGCMAFTVLDPYGNNFPIDNNIENLEITYPDGSVDGCDTTIIYTAYLLNIDGVITELFCTGDNMMSLVFSLQNVSPALTTNGLNITYVWTDVNGDVIPDTDGNPNTADAGDGEVTLTITMEIFGIECAYPFTYLVDIGLPEVIEIEGNLALCDNVTSSSYVAITHPDDVEDVFQWNWTVPSPASIGYGDLSDSIVVNWNGALGGEICVTAVNLCGEQDPPTCIIVVLTPSPTADFSLAAEICQNDTTEISFVGTSTAGTTFNWDFDGGVSLGTSSTDEGPHDVTWSSPGVKTIILNVNENGCPAIPDTQHIEVIAPPAAPILDCSSDENSITFSWTDTFAGSATYTIDLIAGTAGVLDPVAMTYTITGLVDADTVRIIVIADDGGLCGAVYSLSAQCKVQNCTPPDVKIVIPNDSICIDGTPMTMTLTADVEGGVAGVAEFRSTPIPGAIDINGIFDPIVAGPGDHNISLEFVTTADNCFSSASGLIKVAEMPTSPFDQSAMNICITDIVTFTYTGNNTSAVYDWDYGVDAVVAGTDVSWTSAGVKTITLTVTNSFCVSETTTHTVTVDPLLEKPEVNCGPNGSSTSIEFVWDAVTNATSYDVSIDGVPQGNQTNLDYLITTGLAAGDSRFIEITALSGNLCPSVTDTLTCYATECPIANFTGPTELCITDSLVLEFVGVTHDDIFWDTGDAIVDGSSNSDRKILRWTTPGVYDVFLKTAKSGCPEIVYQSTVTVGEALEPIVFNTCVPTLNSVSFSWNTQGCVTDFEVFINEVSQGTQSNSDYLADNLAENDTVNIRVVGISDCICGDVVAETFCIAKACANIVLTIENPIVSGEICAGDDVGAFTVVGTITGDNSGVSGWGPPEVIDNNGVIDPDLLGPGVHEFVFFYELDNCPYSETATFTIHDRPVLFTDPSDPDCYLDNTGSVAFEATSPTGTINVLLDNEPVTNPGFKVGLDPGNHNIIAETNNGCVDDTLFVIVAAIKPVLEISGEPILPIGGSGELVYAGISSITGLIDSVQWSSSEGILCDQGLCESITISPIVADEYCVHVWYNDGCDIEECFRVALEKLEITIVNVFTPGTDDGNEAFNVSFFNTGHELKSMRIYDRWGSEMFSTKEIVGNEASWDGKFKGQPVLPGVYVYLIETTTDTGKVKIYNGDITIVR